ncbi:MAG: winged helix-turn-helix transcriptional regulator [Pseudomonadota bacterium]|jgi:DNA-binding Lrp family transcriptional regulator
MRLTNKTRAVIAQAGLRADSGIPEIAKRAKCRPHTARYILTRLTERGILHKRWVIDLMACGWNRYEIFFAAAPGMRGVRRKMIEWLSKHELCTYLAEVGGEFDFEVIFVARDPGEIKKVLAELNNRCGHFCFIKAVAQHTRVCYFARKYLSPVPLPEEKLALEKSGKDFMPDLTDHQILYLLANSPEISQREIARQIGCTPLTVSRRFDLLKSAGVIRGAMYSVGGSLIGAQNYILLIYARGFGPELADKLYHFCLRHPNCTNMKECFGSWDFEVGVEVLEYARLRSIKEEILESFSQDIVSITVLSRFATHKYNLYPFRALKL